jgi:hypothetical protein
LRIQTPLREQVLKTCRRLLSEINRDPATPTCGCCDRRYWAWKLVDFPEATFQRNLAALAWLLDQPEASNERAFLTLTIQSGLLYTASIQHRNGSFDQAYPYEASYGATAFLLPDLLDAYEAIKASCAEAQQMTIEAMFFRASAFLNKHAELHGTISNHLAGAALALRKAGAFFGRPEFTRKSGEILNFILSKQSSEGWYVEYGGADPGYQTLCMYYLAQLYQLTEDESEKEKLRASLKASLDFLQYFVHPDGTFGGEYGSRRTEVYYPGGITLLSAEFPAAAAMSARMRTSIEQGSTVTLADVDMGNTAPLLNNTIKALAFEKPKDLPLLPCQQESIEKDFPAAGILLRGTPRYYCLIGVSTGGITKIYDKKKARLVLDDCGLLGVTSRGAGISTQMAHEDQGFQAQANQVELWGGFYPIKSSVPTPASFLLLRLMNLTVMRVGFLNELVKKLLVGLLISGGGRLPLKRTRVLEFQADRVRIRDRIEKTGPIDLKQLTGGGKFSSIHMASARYFEPAHFTVQQFEELDVDELNRSGILEIKKEVRF